MTTPAGNAEFTIDGNRLTVRGTVAVEECEGFRDALMELVGSGGEEVVVDVSGVEYVGSSWIGPLAAAMARARTRGVKVKVIAKQKAAILLDVAGLGMLGEVRGVEG